MIFIHILWLGVTVLTCTCSSEQTMLNLSVKHHCHWSFCTTYMYCVINNVTYLMALLMIIRPKNFLSFLNFLFYCCLCRSVADPGFSNETPAWDPLLSPGKWCSMVSSQAFLKLWMRKLNVYVNISYPFSFQFFFGRGGGACTCPPRMTPWIRPWMYIQYVYIYNCIF